ncbi:hypothetical protein LBK6_03635 [Leptospira borgpetersenii serovar Hardjo]|nr:hypothetical protein LBK6_03635 [Leptospira borgpetersenii serovar Hardjo]AMX60721.1 hypothetical protein LBK9_03580 [Leptospira borgpetersenii serovar Hardjo]AMX63966.1 hypothetical protein LBK30_03625 [Leptospira borgpetersenii serovar Hardjo]AMX67206.1 hypothetical protein LBHA_03595 [Leptospira borgpetersenii serovar Hardjo]AMX72111.1 hypothetical protein LBHB_12930 [Leptospira borgpetersenii serovar Hardjo]
MLLVGYLYISTNSLKKIRAKTSALSLLFRDFKFSRLNESELTDVIFKTTFVLLEIIHSRTTFFRI